MNKNFSKNNYRFGIIINMLNLIYKLNKSNLNLLNK